MEAQRYPEDFDGIVAGAPANDLMVQNTVHHAGNVLANRDASGNPILLASRLPLIHDAVVATCGKLDGVTEAKAGVVRRLHDRATDGQGWRLEQRISHKRGLELDRTLFMPAAPGQTTFSENIALLFPRDLACLNVASPNYRLSDFQFTVPNS